MWIENSGQGQRRGPPKAPLIPLGAALAFFEERVSPDGQEPKPSSNLESTQEKKNFTAANSLPQLVTRRTLEAIGVLAGRKVTAKNVEHALHDSRNRATVRGLQVTNDAAERRVALIKDTKTKPKTNNRSSSSSKLFILPAKPSREQRLEWALSSRLLLESHPPTT